MTASARDVAAELRRRVPGLPIKKQHKLLYYCQGFHLAATSQPLFPDTISAWDMGPVVGTLWKEEAEGHGLAEPAERLTDEQLGTIGYVLSRYGALSGTDLEHLTHNEAPYQIADARRPAGGSVRIETQWMREYFSSADAFDEGTELPRLSDLRRMAEGAFARRQSPGRRDDPDELRARLRHSA